MNEDVNMTYFETQNEVLEFSIKKDLSPKTSNIPKQLFYHIVGTDNFVKCKLIGYWSNSEVEVLVIVANGEQHSICLDYLLEMQVSTPKYLKEIAKRNTRIFKKLTKLKLSREKISKELDEILNSLTSEELNTPVRASNSSTLEELILCFVNYGEDENILYSNL
ncbi:MAG: hypothetical protein R3Y33_00040 [Clostridia bacterium]